MLNKLQYENDNWFITIGIAVFMMWRNHNDVIFNQCSFILDKVHSQVEGTPSTLKSNISFGHVFTYAKHCISSFGMCKQGTPFDHDYHH